MPDELETILREGCGLVKDKPILVGVSGGPDSLCLLSLLHEAGWQVVAAHFNHQLRPEAAEEAASVAALARRMQLPFVGGLGDVRQVASEGKLSIEAAARDLRYRFLLEQARRYNAQAVAVGHTADDQVETVLMHFIRGAGLNGLKGMTYRSFLQNYDADIPLVRPLLDLWRTETVKYCEEHGLQPHYDASNDSADFLRNRLRHQLIPILETYNPRFREAVWRSGKTLSSDHEILSSLVESIWQKAALRQAGSYVELDRDGLTAQSSGMQMHLLKKAVSSLLPECEVGYDALQRAVAFVADPSRERSGFTGGLFLFREGNRLYVASDENELPRDQWPQMPDATHSERVSVPFEMALASGWEFAASNTTVVPGSWKDADPFEAWIDAAELPAELEFRVRRDGDRFQPLGMQGRSQKLSDFFINVKLPARARERWPLVVAGDEVIWVPGYRPAEQYRVRPESKTLVHLACYPPKMPD